MIKVIDKKIDKHILKEICEAHFKTMVKFVVDIKLKKMGVGGELHSDAEELLINEGSNQKDIWGANLYPYKLADERLEYTSLIKIRPGQGNLSMEIENESLRKKIQIMTEQLLLNNNESLA